MRTVCDMFPGESVCGVAVHQRELSADVYAVKCHLIHSGGRHHNVDIMVGNAGRIESSERDVVEHLLGGRNPNHGRVAALLRVALHSTDDVEIDPDGLRGFYKAGALRSRQLELVGLVRLQGGKQCAILPHLGIVTQGGHPHHIEVLALRGGDGERTAPIVHPHGLLHQVVSVGVVGWHQGADIAVEDRHRFVAVRMDKRTRQVAEDAAILRHAKVGLPLMQHHRESLLRRMPTLQGPRGCNIHQRTVFSGHNHKLRIHHRSVCLHEVFIGECFNRKHIRHVKAAHVVVGGIQRNGIRGLHQQAKIAHRIGSGWIRLV